jgi:hypothetical protein
MRAGLGFFDIRLIKILEITRIMKSGMYQVSRSRKAVFPLFELLIVYVAKAVLLSYMPLLNALALIVVVTSTEIGFKYKVEDDDGSDPSMVNLMIAPSMLQVRVTF